MEPARSPENHREFLLLRDGGLRRVVTVEGELVPWEQWQRREAERGTRRCACGQVCAAGSARTCGSRECIDRLAAETRQQYRAQEPPRPPVLPYVCPGAEVYGLVPFDRDRAAAGCIIVEPDRDRLTRIARLADAGGLRPVIGAACPLERAAGACASVDHGHRRGRVVLDLRAKPVLKSRSAGML